MPIISDPLDITSNSFLDVTGADVYFDERFSSDQWTTTSIDVKERLLVTASRRISSAYIFKGEKTYQQAILAFPRKNLVDDDGYTVADNIYPYILQEATCELAFKFLANNTSEASDINSSTQQLDLVKLGDLEIDYYKDTSTQSSSGGILSQDETTDIIAVMLSSFIERSKSDNSGFYKIVI